MVSEEKSFESVDGRRTDDGGLPYYKLPRSLRLRVAKNRLISGRRNAPKIRKESRHRLLGTVHDPECGVLYRPRPFAPSRQNSISNLFKVFPSTDCPYRGVKVACFGKSVKVRTREFSTFAIEQLQNKTYNATEKLSLMKIYTFNYLIVIRQMSNTFEMWTYDLER